MNGTISNDLSLVKKQGAGSRLKIFRFGLLLWMIGCVVQVVWHDNPLFLVGSLAIYFFSILAAVSLLVQGRDNEGLVLLVMNIMLSPIVFIAACMWLGV
jgi:hypothetical protein